MGETATITKRDEYLKLLVSTAPKSLSLGIFEAEQAILRLCMECFDQGIELERNGKIEIKL
jgi:hypothetical protein